MQGNSVQGEVTPAPMASDLHFNIDSVLPIDPATFPNLDNKGNIKSTIANTKHLLDSYGITVRYDVIGKKLGINIPGYSGAPDNADNIAIAYIISLASLNGISTGQVPNYVSVIGDRNLLNPAADWITCKPWDGVDRFQNLCDTLVHREDYPLQLKEKLLKRWLISAVAAALMPNGFRNRGVLTLQGPQSIGKTAWISALIPDLILREKVLKVDHYIDAKNKDTFITAVSNWIVELGELETSLKYDVARLKGFLTSDKDRVRRPYGRADSLYPRRTVFAASVNQNTFLVDPTGNTRWWTIPVTQVNYEHVIDMQQLFAQIAIDFHAGEIWWLDKDEEALLEAQNENHRSVSVIAERVLESLDLTRMNEPHLLPMSPSQLLIHIGIKYPTNPQSKECAAVLREYLGDSKRINGINKWRVPLARVSYSPSLSPSASPSKQVNDDDLY